MSSLNEVVAELQSQNETLSDVKDSIKAMLKEDIDKRKQEQRARGDAEEERRERKSQQRKTTSSPKSLRQGLVQGSGLGALADMLPGFGSVLGGASLGGLLGMGIGKLLMPAAAAFLGGKYIGDWLENNLPSIFGSDKTIEAFGKEIKVNEIGGAIAGVVGMLLAPKLIAKTLKTTFGIGAATGRLILSSVIGKMGISAAAGAAGDAVGDLVKEAADPEKVKKNTRNNTKFKKFAQLFKIAGSGLVRLTIPGAIIGTAFAASYLMAQYIENRREKMLAEMIEDMDKYMAEVPGLIAAGKTKEAADRMSINLQRQLKLGENVDKAFIAESRAAVDQMPPGAQKNNFTSMLDAMDTTRPTLPQLDTTSAINYATVQAAGQIASLEETIMKRLPVSFSQLTRNEQEGIVGRMIDDLGLATAGVTASQLAVDFLDANFKKKFYSGRMAPGYDPRIQYLQDNPQAYAASMFKGYTGQTFNIGTIDQSTQNNVSASGNGKPSSDMGRAIDYYHLEKRLGGGFLGYSVSDLRLMR